MVVIAGLVLGLAALYFWLIGHWFGRVIGFLAFAASFGLAGLAIGGPGAAAVAVVVAWFVSGIPIYVRRRQAARLDAASAPSISLTLR